MLHSYGSYFLISIFSTFAAFVYIFFKKRFNYWKDRNIPYIQPIIPFGNVLDVILGRITLGQLFCDAYMEFKSKGYKHGGIFLLWIPVYIPVDENIIKRAVVTDFEYFKNHGFYFNADHDPLSMNIFNLEDYRWKTVRAKFPSAFTSAKMKGIFQVMDRYSNLFIDKLAGLAAKKGEIDIKRQLTKLTVDTVSSCIFGIETHTMKGKNYELVKHGRDFFDRQWGLIRLALSICFPKRLLEKWGYRVFTEETNSYVFNLFNDIKEYREAGDGARKDLADLMVKLTHRDENEKDFIGKNTMDPLNSDEYTAQMFMFFCAGFETTSSTLTFALYELAKNADMQMRLREEINTALAKSNNDITYEALLGMQYLDNVVDETLRLYPVFPILPRVVTKDYQIPGTDATVETGTRVMISNMGLQRDPEYYPNPMQFDPERFLNENKAKRPFISNVPFGEGPRICIGKRFGLLQVKVTIMNIIKNFEVTMGKKTSDSCNFVSNELILRKTGDVWLSLKKIN